MSIGKSGQKILIVDDEPSNIKILKNGLGSEYKIFFATSGQEALDIVQDQDKETPDLILLDIVMDGMDGYTVCRKLKSLPEAKDIPVIFITGKTKDEDESKGFDFGAVDYIKKPFNMEIVRARVRTHTELKRHRDFLKVMLNRTTAELKSSQEEYTRLFLQKQKESILEQHESIVRQHRENFCQD